VPGDDSYPGVFASGRHRFVIKGNLMLFPQIVAVFCPNSSSKNSLIPSS
jgi:hypothetical protein